MSDEEILKLSYKNPTHFGELFDRHNKRFLAIARKSLRTKEDAEDTVQETFVKIYKYGKKFSESEGSFRPWANTILKNCLANQINNYKKSNVSLTPEMEAVLPDTNTQEEFMDKSYVEFILGKMDQATAQILKLRYLTGKSFKQIGQILNIRSGAARVRVYRAKKTFEKYYKQFNAYGE